MASRAERMQQRIRGTGHGQVSDDGFELAFDLGGEPATSDEPSPSPAEQTPQAPAQTTATALAGFSTSAKRRKLADGSSATETRSGGADAAPLGAEEPTPRPRRSTQKSTSPQNDTVQEANADETPRANNPPATDQTPPTAVRRTTTPQPKSPATHALGAGEEVEESPAQAPGTGRRRKLTASGASETSTRLQQLISSADAKAASKNDPLSSPMEQRNQRRQSRASMVRAPSMANESILEAVAEADPLSSSPPPSAEIPPDIAGVAAAKARRGPKAQKPVKPGPPAARTRSSPELTSLGEDTQEQQDEADAAQDESSVHEVPIARKNTKKGRKRDQASSKASRAQSTASNSANSTMDSVAEEEAETEQGEEPAPAKRRGAPKKRESSIKKPYASRRSKAPSAPKTRPKGPVGQPRKPRSKTNAEGGVEIYSQRFTKRKRQEDGDGTGFDLQSGDMPSKKRGDVSSIDVLAEIVSDIIRTALGRLEESQVSAPDAAARREIKTKILALKAYQAELDHRFVEHALYVDHMQSLQHRIKTARRDKSNLRDDLMSIRAEREQVAIRKDALRAQHQKAREESLHQLGMSGALHDMELAIEQGKAAPELSVKEEKKADLANLELLLTRTAEGGCSNSDTGGVLRQLKDFNAFLQRTAMALESR